MDIPDITQLPANNNLRVLTLSNNNFGPILGASDFTNLNVLNTVSIQDTDVAEFPDFGDAKALLASLFLARNKNRCGGPTSSASDAKYQADSSH